MLPRSADSEAADQQLTNADLPAMSNAQLRCELARVQLALGLAQPEQLDRVYVDHPDTWAPLGYFMARERAIAAILRERLNRAG